MFECSLHILLRYELGGLRSRSRTGAHTRTLIALDCKEKCALTIDVEHAELQTKAVPSK